MVISCSDCAMQHTAACAGCVVTHVLGHHDGAVVFDLATERAIRLLARAGMIPSSKHQRASERELGGVRLIPQSGRPTRRFCEPEAAQKDI